MILVEVGGERADKAVEEGRGCELILIDVIVVGLIDDVGESGERVVDVGSILLRGRLGTVGI